MKQDGTRKFKPWQEMQFNFDRLELQSILYMLSQESNLVEKHVPITHVNQGEYRV